MNKLLQLEEWFHPDVAVGQLPSENETFQQIAHVIELKDPTMYKPTYKPNTHWSHWPEGGTL